ncbi:formyltetrahydrofolate deformylase [Pseudokineococcus sp. 1T1Z-3]|uniref:formyltetrahydrofolate deformylase n=1 Tax=Pseudokineococcus sp. 1T1Z-3 TaxID=3132745 RepID=UPI0030AEAA9D
MTPEPADEPPTDDRPTGERASFVLVLTCPDGPGIVHAVSGALAEAGGNITESQQFGDAGTGRFHLRVSVDVAVGREQLAGRLAPVAERFGMTWRLDAVGRPVRTLLLVSRAGHCLNDLLFRQRSGRLPVDVVGVVGNHRDLEPMATSYGVPFTHVPVEKGAKAQAEARLLALVDELDVELVVLARYMQVLSDETCRALAGRAINIHHSFLPSFKGARPYAQAHDRGVKLIGATAHYVTGDLDEGPIIEQDVHRVDHASTEREMVGIGQDVEAQVLARAVRWHAEHRVLLDGHRTVVFR